MLHNLSFKKKIAIIVTAQLAVLSFCFVVFSPAAHAAPAPGVGPGSPISGHHGHGGGGGGGGGAGPVAACPTHDFLGLVPWYNYIGSEFTSSVDGVNEGGSCSIKCFNFFTQSQPNDCNVQHSDIPYVLLAIVDDLLRVTGIVAVAFVIVGAIRYIASQGNPEDTAKAQSTIINALIGLAVAIIAVAFVSFVGSKL